MVRVLVFACDYQIGRHRYCLFCIGGAKFCLVIWFSSVSNIHVDDTQSGLPQSGKNVWKMKFFPGQGKGREFCSGQGNLDRTWEVREK